MNRRNLIAGAAAAPIVPLAGATEQDFVEVSTTLDWNEWNEADTTKVRVAWRLHDYLEEKGEMLLDCWIAPGSGRKHPFKPGVEDETLFYVTRVNDRAHAGRVQRRWPEGLPEYASWHLAYNPNAPCSVIPLAPDFLE